MGWQAIQIGREIGLHLGLRAVWTLSVFYYEVIIIGNKSGIGNKKKLVSAVWPNGKSVN